MASLHLNFRVVILSLGLVLLAFGAARTGWTERFDLHVGDARAALIAREVTLAITMVDIDAASLSEIGVWPWPRSLHARVLETASELGAKAVAFDVDFSAASALPGDDAFEAALANSAAETFLAAFVQEASVGSGRLAVSMPAEAFLRHSWPAAVNVPVDRDGSVRRFTAAVETGTERLDSLPVLLSGREIADANFGIDLSLDPKSLDRVSFVDFIEGRVPPALVEGRILLVGATALELRDLFAIPLHGVVSGSTIIALAAETLHQGRALSTLPMPAPAFVAVALLGLFALSIRGGGRVVVGFAAAALALELLAFWLYQDRRIDLQTGGLQLSFALLAGVAILREFDLRSLLLALSRREATNSRRILERVIEDGFDAVLVLDAAGRLVRANASAHALFPALGSAAAPVFAVLPVAIRDRVARALASGSEAPRAPFDVELRAAETASILECSLASLDLEAARRADANAPRERLVCIALRDVTHARGEQERMRHLAMHDSLTELANRRAFEARLEETASLGQGTELLIFDLDRFKSINDLLGHDVGDLVLREIAARARLALGPDAFVARLGGDEFAAILPCAQAEGDPRAEELIEAIDAPMLIGGHRVHVGACVGIAPRDGTERSVHARMQAADMALQEAKRSFGSKRIVVFRSGMEEARQARLAIEADLAEALETGQFEVVYQPQVEIRSGRVIGAEALLRWNHPRRGAISPGLFIPLAEETGLIHRLGAWVLVESCRTAASWSRPVTVAVNVSSLQFQMGDLVEIVERALRESSLPAERLELEITESAFVREGDELAEMFEHLIEKGVRFSLDDFGTGYSSLGYLHRFPISKIKIDKSFVDGLPGNGHSLAIIRSIMALGEGLGMRVIAEGVETPEQAESLLLFGCREAQGHLFHRPLKDRDMAGLLHPQELLRAG